MKRANVVLAALALMLGGVGRAKADFLTGFFYSVPNNHTQDPDFQGSITGHVTGLVENQLGPDGLPVAAPGRNLTMVNSQRELLWWTASAGTNSYGIQYLGQANVSLPFANPNMYVSNFPNNFSNPKANDSKDFLTVELVGTFDAPVSGTYTFNSGSDDDTWVFIDGNLVVDNGGIHDVTNVTTDINLSAGEHTIDIFYDDRHTTGAAFDLNSFDDPSGSPVNLQPMSPSPAPEPSTLTLLGIGACALLGYGRKRRKASHRMP